MSNPREVVEIDCRAVFRELVDYMECDLAPERRAQILAHLARCSHCTSVYDGVRNVLELVADERAISLPEGFSQRLFRLVHGKQADVPRP